jgi:uncharacterized protein (TIGR02246 family)
MAAASTQTKGCDVDIKREAERIASAYAESFNRQDAAGIAALYATGGVHINPTGPRTDIENFYQALFAAGFNHQEASVDEACLLGDDAAIAIGQYRIAGRDKSGTPIEHEGIGATTYVREGGSWKIRVQTAIPKPPRPRK